MMGRKEGERRGGGARQEGEDREHGRKQPSLKGDNLPLRIKAK